MEDSYMANRQTVPLVSEDAARRDVADARRGLTHAALALDRTYRDGVPPTEAQVRVEEAKRQLSAAECRLEAIRSQRPERHMKAWEQ